MLPTVIWNVSRNSGVISTVRHRIALSGLGLGLVLALFCWAIKPTKLGEPYGHYASEQWQTFRHGDLLHRKVRQVVGVPEVDCGKLSLRQSPDKLNACVTAAWKAKRSFLARWEMPSIDATVENGLAGSGDGHLYQFQYLEGRYVPDYRRMNIRECMSPVVLRPDFDLGVLRCE